MTVVANLFPGFADHRIPAEGAEIFVRIWGSASPLLRSYPRGTCAGTNRAWTRARHYAGA
ncbi:MAG: hypothetical protein J2P51_12005 [Hyphomicrobiaceae bacterium]|nr:hypothetical protein [Hyphomicrobiaceae bacterium]